MAVLIDDFVDECDQTLVILHSFDSDVPKVDADAWEVSLGS